MFDVDVDTWRSRYICVNIRANEATDQTARRPMYGTPLARCDVRSLHSFVVTYKGTLDTHLNAHEAQKGYVTAHIRLLGDCSYATALAILR